MLLYCHIEQLCHLSSTRPIPVRIGRSLKLCDSINVGSCRGSQNTAKAVELWFWQSYALSSNLRWQELEMVINMFIGQFSIHSLQNCEWENWNFVLWKLLVRFYIKFKVLYFWTTLRIYEQNKFCIPKVLQLLFFFFSRKERDLSWTNYTAWLEDGNYCIFFVFDWYFFFLLMRNYCISFLFSIVLLFS